MDKSSSATQPGPARSDQNAPDSQARPRSPGRHDDGLDHVSTTANAGSFTAGEPVRGRVAHAAIPAEEPHLDVGQYVRDQRRGDHGPWSAVNPAGTQRPHVALQIQNFVRDFSGSRDTGNPGKPGQ
ncbi:uncharacterized protein E0L32_010534 [Thyridium curvatum]|uniref:Uncharacterized protein n=1 Tax=Thyridium curvatum TaxID=1093900 RepID=A0A507AG78_9PEZI|nr:uncharacterized protein E0L32_010534 [Thyridium curvatum]TPX07742.1 hypothetical protein E0L32_010534 [Thyridium curvatum]